MRYKTKLDEDDGLGDPITVCREYTHFLKQTHIPELMQQFLEKQSLDQSLKFTSYTYLAPMDLNS